MGTSTDELSAAQLREQLDQQRNELGQDLEAIGDRVSPKRVTERKTAAVRQRLSGVRESVMGAKDTVADKTGDAGSAITDKVSGAVEQVRQGPELARQGAQGNPLAAGLIAFGGGLLLATALPSSNREQRLVDQSIQPQLDQAAAQVGTMAQETVEAVKPAVQDAVAEVKDTAASSASEVADEAKGAAAEVRS